jgi:hypothetical protein
MDGAVSWERGTDRRRDIRRVRVDLPWLRELRLRPCRDVTLVNLSACGALVETPRCLRPNARMEVRLTGVVRTWTVSGSVTRSWVAAVEPERGVVYRGALAFDEVLDLPGAGTDRPCP